MSNPDFARPCLAHNDTSYYIALAKRLDDEELCNMLLTLIHQTISMIGKMIDLVKRDFLVTGGIKEQMLKPVSLTAILTTPITNRGSGGMNASLQRS